MEDVLKRLKLKHTLTTTLIVAGFLFALLAGFFCLIYGSSEIIASKTLEQALEAPNVSADSTNGRRCIIITVRDGGYTFNDEIKYYGDEGRSIIETALSVGNGKFKVGNSYFRVLNRNAAAGTTLYSVYDRTGDHDFLINISLILVMLYVCSVGFIFIIAYLMSARTLKPVELSFKRQRDLVANASHELKTPLTIISTNLSVILSEPNSTVDGNEKWLTSIQTQVSRMNGLIQSMLELSKLEQTVIPKELVNFSKSIEGACLAFEAVSFEKGAALIAEIQPDIHVYGEKNALERLAIILLDNALKYCGENGKIGCKLESDGKKVKLTVKNTGMSLSKEEAEHVFERFYRADGARENPDNQSFGLGLSIAQATVFAHNGEITCRGIEGKGTEFDVILPLTKKQSLSKPSDIGTQAKQS